MSADDHIAEPLPLDAWHRARGARMVPFAGYAMPIQYEGIMAEHAWTREHAGLFDVSHMGQVVFSAETLGTDVEAVLESLVPGDLRALGTGRQRYSLLLADNGGILDDLMIARLSVPSVFEAVTGSDKRGVDRFYMVVNGAVKHEDIAHIQKALPSDIALHHLDEQALLALQGPEAVKALSRLAPGVEALVFMEAGRFQIDGVDAWISRSGYTGEDGFEISIPATEAERVADLLCAQPEVKPIGLGARDSLRLEAGLPLYGHDLNTDTDPVSAGLTFAISKRRREEGGFPGADLILKRLAEGSPTKCVGFTVEGRLPAREGAEIFSGETRVGTITSGGFAPTVGGPIAMGYVDAAHAVPGTNLEIEVRGKRLAATVTPMPFVPHRYVRKGAA